MFALFLKHSPMFFAGEIALCLSLALVVGALIAAIVRRASEISQLREADHQMRRLFVSLWPKRPALVRMFRASLRQRGRWFDRGRDTRCGGP